MDGPPELVMHIQSVHLYIPAYDIKVAKALPTGSVLYLITPIIDFIGRHLTEESCLTKLLCLWF